MALSGPVSGLARISIALFLLRIAVKKWHKLVLKALIGVTAVMTTVYFFIVLFQCSPPSYFWTRLRKGALGSCSHDKDVRAATLVWGSFAVAMDWILGLLPIASKYLKRSISSRSHLCWEHNPPFYSQSRTCRRLRFSRDVCCVPHRRGIANTLCLSAVERSNQPTFENWYYVHTKLRDYVGAIQSLLLAIEADCGNAISAGIALIVRLVYVGQNGPATMDSIYGTM